jgi:hypothetical protein
VRSFIAIICLTAFFALQYGKLISYWHCKFASIYTSTRCDCVQPLLDLHKDTTHHTTGTLKEKTEEIEFFHELVQSWQIPAAILTHEMAYSAMMPEMYKAAIFQPPRFLKISYHLTTTI